MKTITNNWIYSIAKYGILIILLFGCEKEEALVKLPVLNTRKLNNITEFTAISGGKISNDGGAKVINCGVCWDTSANPTIALNTKTSDSIGMGIFKSSITNLLANTKYFVRAYATNNVGTAYGNEVSFLTAVRDVDGNLYHSAIIGTQVWMVENLKTTRYNDGTVIANITDNGAWKVLDTPAYCWYNNNSGKTTYGALYNWKAIDPAVNKDKNICPVGWHVPNDEEWTTLISFIGSERIAGGRMKAMGTEDWASPNTDANNVLGFTALPGGSRDVNGKYGTVHFSGIWWSSSETGKTIAWIRLIYSSSACVDHFQASKRNGYSVRCVRD